jgi:hypothetical protein
MFSHFEKNYPEKIFIKKENTQGVYFPGVFWRFPPPKKNWRLENPEKKKKKKKNAAVLPLLKTFSQKKTG